MTGTGELLHANQAVQAELRSALLIKPIDIPALFHSWCLHVLTLGEFIADMATR